MRTRLRETQADFPIDLGANYIMSTPIAEFSLSSPATEFPSKSYEWCADELHPGPPYLEGGPLDIIKYETNQYEPKVDVSVSKGFWKRIGPHLPAIWPSSHLGVPTSPAGLIEADWGDGSQYGAKGWNKFRPTHSGAEIGVFLGEFREVPRMLMTSAKGFAALWRGMGGWKKGFGPKSVANHWLNTQFGWRPFLNDLRQFYTSCLNFDKAIKQLRRDNGRWVRRGGTVSTDSWTSVPIDDQGVNIGLYPAGPTAVYQAPYGSRKLVIQYDQRVWFKGSFRYWIPGKPDSWQWKARAVAQIFGLQPNPSLVWELTPWSWLIDWVSDAGDAVANLSSILFDNLSAKYAYIMTHTQKRATFTGGANFVSGKRSADWYAQVERKQRSVGSPFGFGLSPGDFSARQWSILAALGLTRLR